MFLSLRPFPLGQVPNAWLEGTYLSGNWLPVTLDTAGAGLQPSGPVDTAGALGVFSPPLRGAIEYSISSQEAVGYVQGCDGDPVVCSNCSLAVVSLEVRCVGGRFRVRRGFRRLDSFRNHECRLGTAAQTALQQLYGFYLENSVRAVCGYR